uniref:Methyltransferase n=1 Tax=Dracunculus medinensis TaxID=318479 RepID=A0A0N4UCH7_DRAME
LCLAPNFIWLVNTLVKRTKLCGDENCTEKLFESKVNRIDKINHELFLNPSADDIINVYAIKFSDRTDLIEGSLSRDPGKRGNFFLLHIHLGEYVQFLKNAILSNKTMFVVSAEPSDINGIPSKEKLIGIKSALPELIKDYEVYSERYSNAENIPPLPKIDYAALGYNPDEKGDYIFLSFA